MKNFISCIKVSIVLLVIGGALHAAADYKAPEWTLGSKLSKSQLFMSNR